MADNWAGKRKRSWVDDIEPGMVILFKSGKLRTAIDVVHRPDGALHSVEFAILRCSWTERPGTVIERTALIQRASCITRARVNLSKSPIAQSILRDIRDVLLRETHCCDVIGVFE